MSVALADTYYGHHRFSVRSFYRVAKSGVFPDDARLELIDGIVFDMEPPGPLHCALATQFVEMLRSDLEGGLLVREEKPILLDDYSLPIPDISIVKQREDDPFFANSHPDPDETALIIEISDSSYLRDRNVKLKTYAQSGIREYWIVNVKKRQVEWFRSPRTESADYAESGIFESEAKVSRDGFTADLSTISF